MKELETLKEMYLDEIKKINKKGELTPTDAEAAKKALEAICMIDDICDKTDDSEWSERSYRGRSYRTAMNRRSMMPDMYYDRRGRSAMTGRYVSRHADAVDTMVRKLENMMNSAPDEETREAIECAIEKLENY